MILIFSAIRKEREENRITKKNRQIWGIILAAGLSERMGSPKLLLPFKGKLIIHHIIDQALLSHLDGVVVVANPNVPELVKEISTSRINSLVANPCPELGMSSSIRKGIAALPETASAAMILLGDMPLMKAGVIDKMIDYYHSNHFPLITQASYLGEKGHPVIFSRPLFHFLSAIDGDNGGKTLIQQFSNQLHLVEMNKEITVDIDTYMDYIRLLEE